MANKNSSSPNKLMAPAARSGPSLKDYEAWIARKAKEMDIEYTKKGTCAYMQKYPKTMGKIQILETTDL